MQSLGRHAVGKGQLQVPCTQGRTHPSPCRRGRQLPRGISAVSEAVNGNGKVHTKQLKFFYFDPANPEQVREMVAQQHDRKSIHHHASSNGYYTGTSNNGFSANGHYSNNGVSAMVHSPTSTQLTHIKDSSKDLAQLQRLTTQLEDARSMVAKLQSYEVLYKEARMRSKQIQVEVSGLQQLLAEKDAELARQYRRMESEASERSGLRTQFNTALDELKALRNELEDARQAVLELRGVLPANVTQQRSSRSAGLLEDGGSSSPDVLSSLQGLAKQLAEGMEHEVGSLFGAAGKRDA